MFLLIWWQGWLIGFGLYVALGYLIAFVLKVTMNVDAMSAADELFFLDDHRNRLNIVAFHKWEKIKDVDSFRKTMLQRAMRYPRLRSRVIKMFGKFMFQ